MKACFFNPVVRAKAHPFGGVLRTYYWCFVASFSSLRYEARQGVLGGTYVFGLLTLSMCVRVDLCVTKVGPLYSQAYCSNLLRVGECHVC